MDISNLLHISITNPTDPAVIMIIPSGWRNYYHVITEDPEEGDHYYSHEFMHLDKVALRYNISPMELSLMCIYGDEAADGGEGERMEMKCETCGNEDLETCFIERVDLKKGEVTISLECDACGEEYLARGVLHEMDIR